MKFKKGASIDYVMSIGSVAVYTGTFVGYADHGMVKIKNPSGTMYIPAECIVGESVTAERLSVFSKVAKKLNVVI